MNEKEEIKAIIGLGNPGPQFAETRHNIGFRIVDALAEKFGASWFEEKNAQLTNIVINDSKKILLCKPQTFMNDSGTVIPMLNKKGIKAENILVVHDELEKPFGNISIRVGGSARGHNGLRSLIEHCGPDFMRLRFGIGRPERKEMVSNYVLQNFTEPVHEIERLIQVAVAKIEELVGLSFMKKLRQ